MQTNSHNGKRIIASSGSFWGADAAAKQFERADEKPSWKRMAEEPGDEDVPATAEGPATEEKPGVEEMPEEAAVPGEESALGEGSAIVEASMPEEMPATEDASTPDTKPTAEPEPAVEDSVPMADDAPQVAVPPEVDDSPAPPRGSIPEFLDATTPARRTPDPAAATTELRRQRPARAQTKPKSPSAVPDSAPAQTEPADQAKPVDADADTSGFARTARRLWTRHRMPMIVGISAIALLIIVYVAGGLFFSSHFLPRTTVNGNDVSLMSSTDFSNQIAHEANGYTAHVTGDGIDLTVAGADVGLALDTDVYVSAATRQVPSWLWPLAIASEQELEVDEGVSIDEDKLRALLASPVEAVNTNSTPTTNANIAYDEDTHTFQTIPEALGSELDPALVLDTVSTEMQGLNSTIFLDDAVLVQPTVSADDARFEEAVEQAADFPDLKLKLVMGGEAVQTLDPDLVQSWLMVADDFSITANVDAVAYYTRGSLSSKLDSKGGYRTYTRPDGKTIKISDGTYGWTIDGSALAELIVERIHEKSAKPIEIPCIQSASIYNPGGADWGNRYIDVDLTEQYARMYDESGNLVWGSDCVSGGPSEGNDTVTGSFYIEDKISPMTLIGLDGDGDGEPDYENDVTYWMPFWGESYGLHDAIWRYTFGGEEYLYDGSHGCVNLPYDAAEELYYLAEVGDAVVVHW